MKKIIEYGILQSKYEDDEADLAIQVKSLIERANALIDGGWQPFGSPIIRQSFSTREFPENIWCQAMVKYEED